MKFYWDTSAVINAFISDQVLDRLKAEEHLTRLHTLGEFFAHMTGRGVRLVDGAGQTVWLKLTADQCVQWLEEEFVPKISWCELTPSELLDGFKQAQRRGIHGAGIYDYWHALAAKKAEADVVLTRNTADFQNLAPKVEWP